MYMFIFSGAAAVNMDSFHLSKGILNVIPILNHICRHNTNLKECKYAYLSYD